jgi:surface antigen
MAVHPRSRDPEVAMRPTLFVRAVVALFAGLLAARADAQAIGAAGQDALENARSGTVVTWRDPDDGTSGSFVPRPAFQDASGRICREFDQTVAIGGRPQQVRGTACRRPDGWWQLQHAAVDVAPSAPHFVPAPVTIYAPPPVYLPPPIVYDYRPVFLRPGHPYARAHHGPSIHIAVGPHRHRHRHFHRHW